MPPCPVAWGTAATGGVVASEPGDTVWCHHGGQPRARPPVPWKVIKTGMLGLTLPLGLRGRAQITVSDAIRKCLPKYPSL